MKKIAIIGNCGSGKSGFAVKLGKKHHLPVIHLDQLYWKPNWTRTPFEEWEKTMHRLVSQKEWIIDGNYQSTIDIRLQAADTIIFLDFSKWVCLLGVVQRRIKYHSSQRPDMAAANKEKISWPLVKWILTYPRSSILEKLRNLPKEKNIIILHSRKELESYLNKVS